MNNIAENSVIPLSLYDPVNGHDQHQPWRFNHDRDPRNFGEQKSSKELGSAERDTKGAKCCVFKENWY